MPSLTAKTATQTKDSGNPDAAAAVLASLQPATPAPVQTGDTDEAPADEATVGDAMAKGGKPFAGLKTIDPAQLRAAVTTPAAPAKPGTPTMPVMPARDDDGDEEDATTAAPSAKDIAATLAPSSADAAMAQHLMKPATPAQNTEAQALPVKFDGKQDSQNGGANTGGNAQNGQQDGKHTAANTAAAATPAQSTPPPTHVAAAAQAAPQPQAKVAETTAAPTINGVTQTQPPAQSTQATLTVSQATQTPATAQPDIAALAVSIAAKSAGGSKHFDIRLDPAELGRIDVHLSVDAAGKAQAHLTADKPQTLEMLQRDSTSLQRNLKDAGVDISNSGLQFSLRGQDQGGGNAPRSFARGRALEVSAVADATPISTTSLATNSARLDIHV